MVVRIKEGAKGALGNTNRGGSVCVSVAVLACAARGWCSGWCIRGGRAGGGVCVRVIRQRERHVIGGCNLAHGLEEWSM